VIGPVGGGMGAVIAAFGERWTAVAAVRFADLAALVVPALTLSVLLSIDTLKTCVVVDALTRSRHNSNRELIGQGAGNFASALIGGMPGSGTMGATLVNVNSGGRTRLSGLMEGVFVLAAFVPVRELDRMGAHQRARRDPLRRRLSHVRLEHLPPAPAAVHDARFFA